MCSADFHVRKRALHQQRGRDERTVPEAEGDVAKVCAVPDADDQVDDEGRGGGRKDLAGCALQVFSGPFSEFAERFRQGKRVKYVITHPAAQRDVPAPPIVGQGCGEQRTAEILHHVDAEHARHAARDVDAAGKVAIQLDAVEENSSCDHSAAVGAGFGNDIVHQNRGAVGDDELFEIAPRARAGGPPEGPPSKDCALPSAAGRGCRSRLIGPCTICGKNETKSAYFSTFFSHSCLPR